MILFIVGCNSQSTVFQLQLFDKREWLMSSAYRYEVAKSGKFPNLNKLSKNEVISLLGVPNINDGDIFIYCLDVDSTFDKPQTCKSSYLTVNFRVDERWKTTFTWVEAPP